MSSRRCGRRPIASTSSSRSSREWTLFGIGLEALVDQFLELDPEWKPPDDRASTSEPTST
jgi:hypothetical protein